ncbi:MAG: TraB/GumN family protein, partial [Ginsengibacter sp.]
MSLRFLIATIFFDLLFILPQKVNSQNQPPKKYQSLLWEITGNGLKKPSYLFGTMHVSNKMVFHLADSFYYALQNVNTVAIELNPEVWQVEMAKLDQLQKNYKSFAQGSINDYLNEASFKLNDYEDELKLALQSEPTIVNGLLYRTYKTKEDFEEDTFLDLYIYQTAKKLGKITTGVEDYFSTEKTVLEAYADMASEKKKNYDSGNESPYETEKKVEDAYRRGDLDLLDSLEKILLGPETFRDKFLIKRNEIQANSIDTILKKNTLFAGVGAAHLPGEKGVIELLRQKGYHLRPVKLIYKNTFRQNEIDKKKVPVKFYSQAPADSLFSVDVPGKMYKMSTDYSGLDRSQFADMSNGTYYLITRVESYNSFSSNTERDVYEKIDSMLYENIPGRIIRKTAIIRNGYNGFDITNKTRRGDIQRYQIFVTPFEILIFKVSGKEMYVNGPEAERYFTSIQLKTPVNESNLFEPKQGGFQIKLPQTPHEYVNGSGTDGMDRLEYSAIDKTTGNSFFIFKKTVTNFGFLDEDTFDLNLAYESFKSSPFIKSDGGKTFGIFKNHPSLDASFTLKDGSYSKLKILLDGPHYYLLAARGKDSTGDFSGFFSSFNFLPFKYDAPKAITDTFLHFKVITPVVPELEENFRALIENISAKSYKISGNENEAYWPKAKNAFFQNEPTGEIIAVSMQQLPQYFQIKDNLNFAEEEKKDYLMNNDMVLSQFDSSIIDNQTSVWRFTITDTGSSRSIQRMLLYNNGRLYRIATMGDTSKNQTGFIKTFFSSFRPQRTDSSMFDINESKTDQFFKDLQSTDSATHTKALSAFSSIHFSKNDIFKLSNLIRNVKFKDKDYFEIKVKAIKELGYIKGEGTEEPVVKLLREVYESTGDTSTFENVVVKSLARNETKSSYKFLKELLMRDPPLFENSYDYSTFFSDINDSLLLARTLYPDILHLLTIDDYKDEITSTLAMLVDSNLISAKDYRNFYTNLYFDAKIALKKQRSKDEKLMKKEIRTDNDD